MAKSYNSYVGNGSTQVFSLTFPYLAKSHVKVYVGGVEDTTFTWLTSSSLTLTAVPANGAIVLIKRVTPTTPLIDFVDGSVVTENLLDTATIQSMYVAEETQDTAATAIILDPVTNKWQGGGKVLNNLADPVDAQDAVTKHWAQTSMDSQVAQATAQATTATTKATEAATSATSAASSATTATTKAAEASTSATNSANSATASASSATASAASASTATTKANEASGSATSAAASASTATTKATEAANSATAAAASATSASTSASTATTKATEASTGATTATAKASEASSSATSAASSATAASTSATSASASAATATTKATESANSATNAASSATAAASSATSASSSQSAAATSATNAATSATSASTSATNAASSATAAAASAASASAAAASGLYRQVLDKTSNYTFVSADNGSLIRANTSSGALTFTLPQISTVTDGYKVAIVKWTSDANAVNIARSGTDTINGATSVQIGSQYSQVILVADFETNTWFASQSGLGATNMNVDRFSGNGSTTAFTLTADPGSQLNTDVFISGVHQDHSTYTISGTTLTFSSAPPSGSSNVEVVYGTPLAIGTPSDGSVSTAKLADSSVTLAKLVSSIYGTSGANKLLQLDSTGKLPSGLDGSQLSNLPVPAGYPGFSTVIFTGSTTWAVPSGITRAVITVIGGGAGGNGGNTSIQVGPHGGLAIAYCTGISGTLTITVGSGGAGGQYGGNGSGGTSSVTGTGVSISATGGAGGGSTTPGSGTVTTGTALRTTDIGTAPPSIANGALYPSGGSAWSFSSSYAAGSGGQRNTTGAGYAGMGGVVIIQY